MRITQDKFNETKYNFWKVHGKFESIQREQDFSTIINLILDFRYEINSFVNSYRSTTFALQKEHRTKNGSEFETWYQESIKTINNDDFSKVIQELRNINQKEGNIYPTFEFKGESETHVIFFDLDPTDENNKFVVNQRLESKTSPTIDYKESSILTESPFTQEDKIKIFRGAMEVFSAQLNLIHSKNLLKLNKIKIERFEKEYSPEEFIINLKRMGKILQDIVDDGWQQFK